MSTNGCNRKKSIEIESQLVNDNYGREDKMLKDSMRESLLPLLKKNVPTFIEDLDKHFNYE